MPSPYDEPADRGYNCPFCDFRRYPGPSERFSSVRAVRELAVHLALAHAEEFRELAQTFSDEYNDPAFMQRAK